jgi:hypothetical protein
MQASYITRRVSAGSREMCITLRPARIIRHET